MKPKARHWTPSDVAALTPAELVQEVRLRVYAQERSSTFWKSATQPETVAATRSTLEALLEEIDRERDRAKKQVKALLEADDRQEMKRLNLHRDGLKRARLAFHERWEYAHRRAKMHRVPSEEVSPSADDNTAVEPHRPVVEPSSRARRAAKRPAAEGASRAPHAITAGGWLFDSSHDTHVAVCPKCEWRTVSDKHDDTVEQAIEHATVWHQDEHLREAVARRRLRAAARE